MVRAKRQRENRAQPKGQSVAAGSRQMSVREQGLQGLGMTVGPRAEVELGSLPSFISGYSDYTPVTIRSHTVRTDNARLERDQSGN